MPECVDNTEGIRRVLVEVINLVPGSREELEAEWGQVWNTEQIKADFEVLGFLAPFVHARRRWDGQRGVLTFQHSPRFYWGWVQDDE